MEYQSIDVIIPVYKPDKKLEKLLTMLVNQTVRPRKIILMNTECFPEYSTEFIKQRVAKAMAQAKVFGQDEITIHFVSVAQNEFDHGKTRGIASTYSDAEYMVYMTQDAIPKDFRMLEELTAPMKDSQVAVVYGRQEASINAGIIEQYTRIFNYPEKDRKKTKEDIPALGIKTFFCSNVCACYRRETFDQLGGFVTKTIFNEDMIYAAKAINAGYAVYYASKAKVIHSHDYTLMQQLRRNFDLGVSQRQYKQYFDKVSSESEGIKMIKQTVSYLWNQKRYFELYEFVMESGFKYIGYFLGRRYTYLPQSLCVWLSMNKAYWR